MPARRFIGVDCNTTGLAVVVAIPHTDKVHKLRKSAIHVHTKYKSIRARLQKHGKYSLLQADKIKRIKV